MRYLFFVLFLYSCAYCTAQQNDFKYQGEMPRFTYGIHHDNNLFYPVESIDSTDSVLERNRIYVIVTSEEGILLNSHPVDVLDFAASFHYVFANPDQLEHLPVSPDEAMIFIKGIFEWSTTDGINPSHQRYAYVLELIKAVVIEYYHENELPEIGKTFSELTKGQQDTFLMDFFEQLVLLDLVESEDEGIRVKLPAPPYLEEERPTLKLRKRNVYRVVVNANNELWVRGKPMKIEHLKENTKKFLSNYGEKPELSESPKHAIISLQNDRGTKYEIYIQVYKELKAAYQELWEEEAQKRFGRPFDDLTKEEKHEIRAEIPLVISEAEPTNFGQ